MNSNLVKANNWYRKSQDINNGLCQALRQHALEKALAIYNEEVKNTSPDNLPSLLKNLGMANLKLAQLIDPQCNLDNLLYYLKEAIKSYCTALIGKNCSLDSEWSGRIQECLSISFDLAFRSVLGDVKIDRVPKFPLLQKLFNAIGSEEILNPVRVLFLVARGRFFLRCGVTAMEDADFKTTLQMIEYCRDDTELARNCNRDDEIGLTDIKRLDEDHTFLRYSCDSIKARVQADQLFDTYVSESEEVDFDMMWDLLDMYKDAALKAREQDIENEALAMSREGRMFDKIFKLRTRAHKCYRQAFDLAMCLHPRDLNNVEWFLECKEALDRFQREIRLEEEERLKKSRAPILERLAPVLVGLNAVHAKSDPYALLAYIYATHPPRRVEYSFDPKKVTSENVKQELMKAIMHYHPDKQVAFDREWQVLCEEIIKCLNVRYGVAKGCD